MRRVVLLVVFTAIALMVLAPAALSFHKPAFGISPNACNQGTARAYAVSSANANSPHYEAGVGCHIHVPASAAVGS